jgi:hypothetical protein
VFKWKPDDLKLLPSQNHVDYNIVGSTHTNKFFRSLNNFVSTPFRKIAITDDQTGLDKDIEIIPMWNDVSKFGGCYKRLKFFSKEMKYLIGDRIVQCDIDTIITGDITDLIDNQHDLILYRHHQHLCNGGFWVMNSGVRHDVWENFIENPEKSIKDSCGEIGTDQGWLKYYLKSDLISGKIKTVSREDGIYDMRSDILKNNNILPKDCRMVTFGGPRDPSDFLDINWVKKYWGDL